MNREELARMIYVSLLSKPSPIVLFGTQVTNVVDLVKQSYKLADSFEDYKEPEQIDKELRKQCFELVRGGKRVHQIVQHIQDVTGKGNEWAHSYFNHYVLAYYQDFKHDES